MLEHLSISSSHGSRVQNKKQLTVVRPNASRKHKQTLASDLVGVFNSWWVSTKQVHILLFFTVAVGHAYLSALIPVVKLVASCLTVAHHASYLFFVLFWKHTVEQTSKGGLQGRISFKGCCYWWWSLVTEFYLYRRMTICCEEVFFPSILPPPICYTYMFPIAKHNFKRKLYNDLIY